MHGRFTSRQVRSFVPQELTGLQFYKQRKVGRGRRPSSFFSRWHAFIISSSWCKGVFLFLHGKARCTITFIFPVCREHVLGITNLLSSLGKMWVSRHHRFTVEGHGLCASAAWLCWVISLLGFAVKQTYFLEYQLTGVSHIFSAYNPPSGINYLITYFVLYSVLVTAVDGVEQRNSRPGTYKPFICGS